MKIPLFFLVVLSPAATLFSQLYVTPDGSTDTYIYVSNEVLFVDQQIDLIQNTNDPTTQASIYLRDQAQLLQADPSFYNTGTGSISVFQDSNSDSYDYNFWASPVGNPTDTGNQNFGMNMVEDSLSWTNSTPALFTPGYNGASDPLTISTRWLYRWNPTTQRWVYNGTGKVIPVGYGFIMKGTDVTVHKDPLLDTQNQLYDFRGRPNNGDITLPIQYGVPAFDGIPYNYTLAGNPYPSALNLYDVFWDEENTEIDSFKYWDEDRSINSHYYIDNKGGYGTWMPGPNNNTEPGSYAVPSFLNYASSGIPSGGSTGEGARFERLNAPIGQGFMIEVKEFGDGFITIKNSHRLYMTEGAGNNSEFRAPIGGGTPRVARDDGDSDLQPQIRIHTYFGQNTHFRDMVLLFNNESTDGYDRGMDASHPMDGALAEAYFKIGNSPNTDMNLVIQSVPFIPHKKVPIAFSLEQEMKFLVKAVEQINTPFSKAYLFDSTSGSYQEITDEKYAEVHLPSGVYEDRFFLVFRGNDTGRNSDPIVNVQAELSDNVDFFQNNPIARLEIHNPRGYDIGSVNIFDIGGRLILSRDGLGAQEKLSFPTDNFSDGIYLVKLSTADNMILYHKIIIFNK